MSKKIIDGAYHDDFNEILHWDKFVNDGFYVLYECESDDDKKSEKKTYFFLSYDHECKTNETSLLKSVRDKIWTRKLVTTTFQMDGDYKLTLNKEHLRWSSRIKEDVGIHHSITKW